MNSSIQTNVQQGKIAINAGANLTDKEGYLTKIADAGSEPELVLPSDVADICTHVIDQGSTQDTDCEAIPLTSVDQIRLVLNGTCSAGDTLVNDGTTPGQVEVLPVDADNYFSPGIALEDGVDGQHIKVQVWPREITVS